LTRRLEILINITEIKVGESLMLKERDTWESLNLYTEIVAKGILKTKLTFRRIEFGGIEGREEELKVEKNGNIYCVDIVDKDLVAKTRIIKKINSSYNIKVWKLFAENGAVDNSRIYGTDYDVFANLLEAIVNCGGAKI
jgi:hypothetical protein